MYNISSTKIYILKFGAITNNHPTGYSLDVNYHRVDYEFECWRNSK